MIMVNNDNIKVLRRLLWNWGTCFGRVDIAMLVFILLVGGWYTLLGIKADAIILVLFICSLTIFMYLIGKVIFVLLSFLPVPLLNKFLTTIYFCAEEDKDTLSPDIINIGAINWIFSTSYCYCSYEQIQTIIVKYNLIYMISPIPHSKFLHSKAVFCLEALQENVTVHEWLDTVKQHNPNVKIKAYKHRFWMF